MVKQIHVKRIYASETVYELHSGQDNKDTKCIFIEAVYTGDRPERIDVCACDCSEACLEHYGNWGMESFIHVRGEAARKLADKFTARDAQTLLDRMCGKFRPCGWAAFDEIGRWLEAKGIAYSIS